MLLRSLVLRYQRASAGSSPESRSAGCGNSLTLSTPSSGQFLGMPDCLQILERIFWSDNLKASCREQQFAKLCGVNEGLKGASDIGIS